MAKRNEVPVSVQLGKKVILWAVDPFEKNRQIQRSAAWAINALTKASNAIVQPVYVCPPAQVEFLNISGSTLKRTVHAEAAAALKKILGPTRIFGLKPLHVLLTNKPSLAQRIEALVCYAKQEQAELIVVSSHGRSGPARWLLGSFAETLTLQADIPLFVVNPLWKKSVDFKKILFPTDFSAESKAAFRKVLDMAAREQSRIVIFCKLGMIGVPPVDFAYVSSGYYAKMEEAEAVETMKNAEGLAALAKKRGVEATIEIERVNILSVAESILKRANRENCLIAMAAQSGKVVSTVLGSTTRQVIRGAKQPVWIIRPNIRKAKDELRLGISQEEINEELYG